MSIEQITFYLFAAMLLGSALLVVTIKSLVRSIFMFFVVLFTLAGLYIFAMADFIAVAQVIIYVGGVLVLMLFAFLLSSKELLTDLQPPAKFINLSLLPGILLAMVFLFMLVSAILNADISHISWLTNNIESQIKPSDNTIHSIGINIMTRYLLPFEVISIFLMMALIGAAHIARKGQKT
ncbi:MAG TPA: NADH-quinone oxidoreductase subunit N [Sphingobacteriaceae bacterium]|nr:NADH-quinone oxidoreductase subunit N [Sphingobacteriaceae bacterium]